MLKTLLHEESGIVQITPSAKVSKANITKAAKEISPWIKSGASSLLISNETYEDWDTMAKVMPALIAESDKTCIDHIAISTAKPTGEMRDMLLGLYPTAKLNIYCYSELEEAMDWLTPETAGSAA